MVQPKPLLCTGPQGSSRDALCVPHPGPCLACLQLSMCLAGPSSPTRIGSLPHTLTICTWGVVPSKTRVEAGPLGAAVVEGEGRRPSSPTVEPGETKAVLVDQWE